jgi:hypothetical protein
MRVSSLVLLIALVLAGLYVFVIRPPWVMNLFRQATGYGPAATATEAVDKFMKAVHKRDLETASHFCTGDYAEHLKRGSAAAAELCPLIDGISEYMKNKGLATDKSITYLHFLDPFPTNFKMGAAPKEKDAAALGFFLFENIWPGQQVVTANDMFNELKSVDPRMYNRVLMPINLTDPRGVEIVKDGDAWKMKFPLPAVQVQALDHFLANYKSYVTGLTVFRRDVTNDRFPGKSDFERELLSVLQKAK